MRDREQQQQLLRLMARAKKFCAPITGRERRDGSTFLHFPLTTCILTWTNEASMEKL